MCESTPATPTTTTRTGGHTVLSRLRWKHIVSAVALGMAVWVQVHDPKTDMARITLWLGVAISGHLVSKIPGGAQ